MGIWHQHKRQNLCFKIEYDKYKRLPSLYETGTVTGVFAGTAIPISLYSSANLPVFRCHFALKGV